MLRAAFTSALHRPALQASHSKTAWLLRFSGATCPHAEQRCDVYAAGTCSTRPEALCCNRVTSWPQPLRLIPRLSPRFWATPCPGCSTVPRATRVMARTSRSSIRSCRTAARFRWTVFSTQSLRRSRLRPSAWRSPVSSARGDSTRGERGPAAAAAPSTGASPAAQAGTCSSSPVDNAAATARPVDAHHVAITRAGDRSGHARTRHASGPPGPGSLGRTSHPRHRAREAKSHPPDLGHPDPTERRFSR